MTELSPNCETTRDLMGHMIASFGWKALLGIIISNTVYYAIFRRQLARLQKVRELRSGGPLGGTVIHVEFVRLGLRV